VRTDHRGNDPRKISLIVQAPSVRDPSLAPPGKSTLTIHCAARLDYEDHWKTDQGLHRGDAYRDLKEEYARILIDRVERAMGVDLLPHIEVCEVATPVTYWRYSRNRGGSTMGQKPTMKNIAGRVAHYHTPVRNLFLGGHWAEYGGGIPIAVKAVSTLHDQSDALPGPPEPALTPQRPLAVPLSVHPGLFPALLFFECPVGIEKIVDERGGNDACCLVHLGNPLRVHSA
jgi:hypothetical protein